jgi:hypothetical protein
MNHSQTPLVRAETAAEEQQNHLEKAHQTPNPNPPQKAADPGEDEDAARHPRGRPYEPGQSGNPKGRPKGSRNKTTLAIEALLDGEWESITRKLIEKAQNGDMSALRLCLERLLPLRRDPPVAFVLPEIKTAADALKASSAVLQACAEGVPSPSEAAQVMELISSHVRVFEVVEFEARLGALEAEKPDKSKKESKS